MSVATDLTPTRAAPPELEVVTRSQRVSSRRLREASGWKPQVRAGIDGWRLVADAGKRLAA